MFRFELKQIVTILESQETGRIVARSEWLHAEPSYYVRYADARGVAVENWWTESALGNPAEACVGGGGGVDEVRPAQAEPV